MQRDDHLLEVVQRQVNRAVVGEGPVAQDQPLLGRVDLDGYRGVLPLQAGDAPQRDVAAFRGDDRSCR